MMPDKDDRLSLNELLDNLRVFDHGNDIESITSRQAADLITSQQAALQDAQDENKRLLDPFQPELDRLKNLLVMANSTITSQQAEIKRLSLASIHSCGEDCQKIECVQRREIDTLKAMLKDSPDLNTMEWVPMFYATHLEWVNWFNRSRKLL